MLTAAQIKEGLLGKGFYHSEEELTFLTDEYLRRMQKHATEITHEKTKGQLVPFGHVWSGNSWHDGVEGGARYWYWKSAPGSQCGQTQDWKYKVNSGDSVVRKGNCPQGYPWFEMVLNYP